MRFDKAAEFLAGLVGFTEQKDLCDRAWVGDNFQEKVRTSGREQSLTRLQLFSDEASTQPEKGGRWTRSDALISTTTD
jgi:hypothetical protein